MQILGINWICGRYGIFFLSFYALETDLRFKYLDFGIHFKMSIIGNLLHSESIILFSGKRYWSKKSPQF